MDDTTGTEDLVRLIYRSRNEIAPDNFKQELGKVFLCARRNNKGQGITGALMYYDNTFAQALEGPAAAVRSLFQKISADARHSAVEVKEDKPVESRVFSRWAMANVGEHGDADTPLIAHGDGVAASEAWKTTAEQEAVLTMLRDATRGYGRAY